MYLDQIDDVVLRRAVMESIRGNVGLYREVSRSTIVQGTLINLAKQPGIFWRLEVNSISSQLASAYVRPYDSRDYENSDVRRIESVLWELIGLGLVYPRFGVPRDVRQDGQYLQGISSLVVTPLGERYFAEGGAVHPAAPDFVSASVAGIADLPAEVRTNLEDAQVCFQYRLLRAAVVMLGLAYEAMAIEIYRSIVPSNNSNRLPEAKVVLKQIMDAVNAKDESVVLALNAAEAIRQARNRAAHDWKLDHSDVRQVETLLILGGQNVAPFWALKG